MQIESETKLTTVMRQRMGATNDMINSVKSLTAAQQGVGVVGDEVQMAGVQQLATFMNSTDALNSLIPAMNNLSVQQNGVSVTGENMTAVANMMGKAMQGQASALTRVGITMTEAQEAAMENGNEMERSAMLAQIITDNVGSMNEAMANTPQGVIQQMSNTWGDMKEVVGGKVYPAIINLFQTIMSNQPQIEAILAGFATGVSLIVTGISNIISISSSAATFVSENWGVIAPIFLGITAAIGIYTIALLAHNIMQGISSVLTFFHAKAVLADAGAYAVDEIAAAKATVAQWGFNGAILSCPIVWITILIIALIAAVIALANGVGKAGITITSAFAAVCGAVSVTGAFFKNLGIEAINIMAGIGAASTALGDNMITAFGNSIANVKGAFYKLAAVALNTVADIGEALNKLPFVEFDVSGLRASADAWSSKAQAEYDSKGTYTSIGAAYTNAYNSSGNNAFQEGWAKDAYNAGKEWGNNAAEKISDKLNSLTGGLSNIGDTSGVGNQAETNAATSGAGTGAGSSAADTAANTGATAANTAAIAKSVNVSSEDLKYLKDIAERDTINRFTTAEIKVDMTNNNSVASGTDIDDLVNNLTMVLDSSLRKVAEGVHL